MDFEEAERIGLVNRVIEASDSAAFLEEVIAFARQFVPPARAAKAVGAIKRAVHSGLEASLEGGLALERELQQQLFESSDAREGFAAFLEKRSPAFQGR